MDISSGIVIARIRGVAIKVHWSWVLIFGLITWSLADSLYPEYQPGLSENQLWIAGAVSSLFFFASVLIHELSHTFMAQHYGMQVPSITLFVFGGVSQMAGEMRTPRQEFMIAIVGPLSSWVLAVVFGVLWLVTQSEGVSVIFGYLALINFALGAFNLLPGFPLDGGRVFRSIVWGRVHDLTKATRIASTVGQVIAWLMIIGGLLWVFFLGLGGLWYVLIGLFLKNASEQAYAQVLLERALGGVVAADVMRPPPAPVPEGWSLEQVAHERVLGGDAERAFFTESLGRVSGLITITDLMKVPRDRWGATTVHEAMVPSADVHTVQPDTSVLEATRLMQEHDVNQLPVLDDGRLVGLLTRADVLKRLELKTLVGNLEGSASPPPPPPRL